MKQILHIFRKDVRQHWLAILFSVAVQAAYAWNEPRNWLPTHEMAAGSFRQMLSEYLPALLMLAWSLLIVRAVQSESLVGDVQYWITRPVEWKVLLMEKLLFAAVFVEVPLLIASLYLLIRGGFQPTRPLLLEIIWSHIIFAALLLLPVVALATVTPGIGQMALALIAVGVFLAGTEALTSYLPTQCFCDAPEQTEGSVLVAACGAVVIWQYARRRTKQSRIVLASTAIAILILVVATPYDALLARKYPRLSPGLSPGEQPVQFAFLGRITPLPSAPEAKKDVRIHMPLRVSGTPDNTFVEVDGSRIAIEAQDGSRWSSGWNYGGAPLFSDQQRYNAMFTVDKDFFNRVRSNLAKVHVSLAVTTWHEPHPVKVVATEGMFEVPDVGLCSIEQETYSSSVLCRFAVQGPSMAFLEVQRSESTCPAAEGQPAAGGNFGRAWGGNSESGPLSPVATINLNGMGLNQGSGSQENETGVRKRGLAICPGTLLHISRPKEARRFGVEIDLPDLRLADYRAGDPGVAGYAYR